MSSQTAQVSKVAYATALTQRRARFIAKEDLEKEGYGEYLALFK